MDGPPTEPTPVWKKWWFITGVVVVVGAAIALVVASQDDEPEVSAPPPVTEVAVTEVTLPEISIPESSVPEISIPEISVPVVPETPPPTEETSEPSTSAPTTANAVVGDTVTLDDGTLARVNSVTPNAPPFDDFFPPEAGTTLSRVDVEVCAGSEGYSANSLYWLGFLEDNTSVDPFVFGGDLPTVGIAPGSCIRGSIDLQVPDGHTLASVVMRGTLFEEAARWDVTSSVPVSAPLQSPNPSTVSGLGETITLSDGSTAVVKSVVPNAPPLEEFFPPDPGRQYVRVEVEQSAGSVPRQVNPAYWYAAAEDNSTGEATFGGSTLASIQLAPGECAAGFVEIDLPAAATVATVFVTDEALQEAARWRAA